MEAPLRVRARPEINRDNILENIQPGTAMTVLDGPVYSDGHAWWRVRVGEESVGWIAERSQAGYLVEPCWSVRGLVRRIRNVLLYCWEMGVDRWHVLVRWVLE
jgi:hypothetical protein